jgi:hypothetical protein
LSPLLLLTASSAVVAQASKITLTSRAFHNDILGKYEKYVTELFGYDRVSPFPVSRLSS